MFAYIPAHHKSSQKQEKTLEFAHFLNNFKGFLMVREKGLEPSPPSAKALINKLFYDSVAKSVALSADEL